VGMAPASVLPESVVPESAVAESVAVLETLEPLAPSRLVAWFRRITVVGIVVAVLAGGYVALKNTQRPSVAADRLYLDALTPTYQKQGYGELRRDASVDGGVLELGEQMYPRGLGTHAPFELVYDIPTGYSRFMALVGLNRHASGLAKIRVFLDGRYVRSTGPFGATDPPGEVDIPLMGAMQLKLLGLDLGDKNGDHVDLANVRLEK
jgi:hypothetical protein